MSKTYVTTVFEDENGEHFIEIPVDILSQMRWGVKELGYIISYMMMVL